MKQGNEFGFRITKLENNLMKCEAELRSIIEKQKE
jgi:hypothetical protein